MELLKKIKACLLSEQILYSRHARNEMLKEEFGRIYEQEVFEVIRNGEIIEKYPEDKPYPSCLIFGETEQTRPLHVVLAYNEQENLIIIVTVYHPDATKWINYKQRTK